MCNLTKLKNENLSHEIAELILDNDQSKLKPWWSNPLTSPGDKIKENKPFNICGNQAPCSSRIGYI